MRLLIKDDHGVNGELAEPSDMLLGEDLPRAAITGRPTSSATLSRKPCGIAAAVAKTAATSTGQGPKGLWGRNIMHEPPLGNGLVRRF